MPAMRTRAAFKNNCLSILDKHASKKKKLGGIQKPHFN